MSESFGRGFCDDTLSSRMARMLEREKVSGAELVELLTQHGLLSKAFGQSLGGKDALDLRTHTMAVMRCLETRFGDVRPEPFRLSEFKLLIALHDVGKPRAIREGVPWRQGTYSCMVIDRLAEALVLPNNILQWVKLVVGSDPIGSVLSAKSLRAPDDAAAEIFRIAAELKSSVTCYWSTLLVYFQCDVCGYASLKRKVFVTDAAGEPVWSQIPGRFLLRDKDEAERLSVLEERVLALTE